MSRLPFNLFDAMRSKDVSKWEDVIQEEHNSLMGNGMWELTMVPKDCKSINCKWIFHTKRGALGQIIRHKTRLVAKGYS